MSFTKVCSVGDIWEGEMEPFTVDGHEILLVGVEGGDTRAAAEQVRVERAIGEEQLLAQRNSTIAGLDQLCLGVLPVWNAQLELVRSHTEDAALSLTGRFSEISDRLRASVAQAQAALLFLGVDAAPAQLGQALPQARVPAAGGFSHLAHLGAGAVGGEEFSSAVHNQALLFGQVQIHAAVLRWLRCRKPFAGLGLRRSSDRPQRPARRAPSVRPCR